MNILTTISSMSLFLVGLLVSWTITAILVCCTIELFKRVKALNNEVSKLKGGNDDV